jgi:hypothetical protein
MVETERSAKSLMSKNWCTRGQGPQVGLDQSTTKPFAIALFIIAGDEFPKSTTQ